MNFKIVRRSPFFVLYACLLVLGGCESDGAGPAQEDASVDTTKSTTAKPKPDANEGTDQTPEEERATARADRGGTIHPEPPLDIDGLLEADDVAKVTDSSEFDQTELPGKKPNPRYNARRLQPADGGGYGAGIQVWSFDSPDSAKDRLEELRSQYLNVEDPPDEGFGELADKGFVSARGGIRNFVFSVEKPPRLVAVSCADSICDSDDALGQLAGRVAERIGSSD